MPNLAIPCIKCPATICGQDIDDAFAYSTTKTVRIRDHRLGCIYVGALFLVFCYIGVYSLAYALGYLDFHKPFGTARFSLRQPSVDFCDTSDADCMDDFPNKSSLAYCCQDECAPDPENAQVGGCSCPWRKQFRNYDCAFYDGDSASRVQRFGIFIVTRVKQEVQHANQSCSKISADSCQKLWLKDTGTDTYTRFVTGIENFTVLIDHAAQVPEINFYKQARDVVGRLKIRGNGPREQELCTGPGAWTAEQGGSTATSAPCYLEPYHPQNSTLDFYRVSTLLTAAQVDLDQYSFAGSNHSARYEGMTMMLNINWHNTAPWSGVGTPGYTYEVFAMAQNAYSVHDEIWAQYQQNRTLISSHGIMLQGNIVGQIANFDFNTLLLQLTASLTLLAVATFVVNYTATCCLKYKYYYQNAMADVTADFSEVDHLEALDIRDLKQMCRRRFLPANGKSKIELINALVMDGYTQSEFTEEGSNGSREAVSSPALDVSLPRASADHARGAPLMS